MSSNLGACRLGNAKRSAASNLDLTSFSCLQLLVEKQVTDTLELQELLDS